MYFLFPIGSLGKHMRNLRGTDATIRSLFNNSEENKRQNKKIIEILSSNRKENSKFSSLFSSKIPDIGEYFPIPDEATLNRFLDESDGMYAVRCSEFYNLLKTCVTVKQNLFGSALIKTVFGTNYLIGHTWPPPK